MSKLIPTGRWPRDGAAERGRAWARVVLLAAVCGAIGAVGASCGPGGGGNGGGNGGGGAGTASGSGAGDGGGASGTPESTAASGGAGAQPGTGVAREGGGQQGPTPNLVPTLAGTDVDIGRNLPPGDLPAWMYTCARCHLVPSPEVLPRDRWRGALTRMNELIKQFHLGEALDDRVLADVIAYYEARAATSIPMLPVEAHPAGRPSPIVWQQGPFGLQEQPQPGAPFGPVIAGVNIADLNADGTPDVLFSDAKNNIVTWIAQTAQGPQEVALAQVAAPARTSVLDIDDDGDNDVLVASLGSLQPTDDLVGSIRVLENRAGEGFVSRVLLENEPRACDVRPADLDGDGDLDIAFATFGLYHTGRAGWLERTGAFEYTAHELLKSNGVSHVPTGDVNGDGLPDIAVLVSQQHERVVLYVNRGEGEGPERFREVELWRAPHPMWGNSSAELVDLDQDGDLDMLFTNGDALDSEPYSKPWHGVQWLENQSEGEAISFVYRRIGGFHGAYWAGAGDFDLDGDLDVFVTSMMNQWQDSRRAAMVWFENDGHESFTLRPVNVGPTYQVVGDVGDMDGDGRADVITGGMYVYQPFFRVARGQLFMPRAAPGVGAPAGGGEGPAPGGQ
ncbi:MAG: FG-GAP-like repeat-containing protein [Phycisphaerales bacterium]